MSEKAKPWFNKRDAIEMLILLVIVLFIRFYVFQFFRVSGPSMCPTLNLLNQECQAGKGEFVFVNEFIYRFEDPKRGDVVVFNAPNKDVYYIKRIIGIPGDKIQVANGRVFLTNEAEGFDHIELEESYLSAVNKNRTDTTQEFFQVPKGQYLLFGDNRNQSLDARRCFTHSCINSEVSPYLPKSELTGRAEFVIWPFWKMRWLKNPTEDFLYE